MDLSWSNLARYRQYHKTTTTWGNVIPRVGPFWLPVNSSHGQLVTWSTRHMVNSSPGRLVTQSTRHKEAVDSSQANKQANIKAVLPQQYKTADLENLFQVFHYLYDYLWQLHWSLWYSIKKDRPVASLKRKPSPLHFSSWRVKQQQQHRDSCATTSDQRGSTPARGRLRRGGV